MNSSLPYVLLAMVLVSARAWGLDQEPQRTSDSTVDKNVSTLTIRGKIETQFGKPIGRVQVKLESYGKRKVGSFLSTALSDENGKFQFENVEPGFYRVSARKNRWQSKELIFTILENDRDEKRVTIQMELTPLYQTLAYVQFGSLTYVAFFGILIFVANFFIAPRPVSGVTYFAWLVCLLSLAISWIKVDWTHSLPLSIVVITASLLLQTWGTRVASRRTQKEDEEKRAEEAENQLQLESIQSLVGKEGVTTTDLKACGSVHIEGKMISAKAMRGYIPLDTRVIVRMVEGKFLVVEPLV